MKSTITIKPKSNINAASEHIIISVRIRSELLEKLNEIAVQANRSRNEIINILLESAIEIATVQE